MTRPSEPFLRRTGVIGDIHCEDEVLERVLSHFSRVGTDTVLAVGDIVDGMGDVNRACSLLAAHDVLTVAGNHDRWLLANSLPELPNATVPGDLGAEARRWLQQLPRTRSFQTSRGRLLLCHGLGEDDLATIRPEDEGYALESNLELQALVQSRQYRFVVCGHSHQAMVRNIRPLTIVNAGTLDRHDRQVCAVIDFEQGSVEFFDAGGDLLSSAERFPLA